MNASLILALSVVLQFVAAFLALRLIPLTGRRRAWIMISAALFFMGARRCMTLYEGMLEGVAEVPELIVGTEWVTLIISVLMLAGIGWIAPLFQSMQRSTEALRESELRFRALSETVPTPIFICQEGRIRYANPSAEAVSGYTKDELLAMDFVDLIHPDFLKMMNNECAMMNSSLIAHLSSSHEARILTRKSEERWLDLSTAAFELEGLPALLISARDTTRRRQAEEELKRHQQQLEDLVGERTGELMETVGRLEREIAVRTRAEEAIERLSRQHRLILESVTVGIFGLDLNGKVTFVNPSAARMLGWGTADLIGQGMHPLVHHSKSDGSPYSWEECSICRAYLTGATQHIVDEVFWRKDGTSFPVEYVSIPMRDEEVRAVGTIVTFDDITERRRAEDLVKKERERFSLILDGNPIPSFVIDREHRVVLWNRACESLTGVSKEEVLGRLVDSAIFYPGSTRPILVDLVLKMDMESMERLYGKKYLARCSFHPEAFEASDQLMMAGGKKDIYFLAARLKDSNGEIIGAIETLQDVTERVALQRQLRQTQKMEAIGTLAGGIAHDFNNVLTVILGYTEIAMDDLPGGSRTHRSLEQVFNAGIRAKDLVRQILTFSRQGEQERQPVRISRIAKEALHFLRASLPSTITIRQKITSDSALVLADATQIHQVLMNLCTNAAHAMRETGGELEVALAAVNLNAATAGPDLAPGPYVKLTVSDTGHGMDREVMERIFDPYFTTKKPGEGTGMGLSVVHGIVRGYGGAIRVSSESGSGTAFEILIPRVDHASNGKEAEAREPLPTGTERIFLVDDEEALAEMEQLMLERLGYQVTVRTGSLEALEAFRAEPHSFDLVITDQTMPNMTGVELCKELLEIRPDIPIILCTGFSDLITPEKAKAMGIGAFIGKPLVRHEIALTIRKLLDKKAG